MHPGSKDYTQRFTAGSILLDGSVFELVEEFLREWRLSQFERGRRLVELGSSPNELVKTGGHPEDKADNQQPRARAEPAIQEPTDDQATNHGREQRDGRTVGNARLDVGLFLVVVRHFTRSGIDYHWALVR